MTLQEELTILKADLLMVDGVVEKAVIRQRIREVEALIEAQVAHAMRYEAGREFARND